MLETVGFSKADDGNPSIDVRYKNDDIASIHFSPQGIEHHFYSKAQNSWSKKWFFDVRINSGVEFFSDGSTANGSSNHMRWQFADGTIRQLTIGAASIALAEYSNGTWKTLWTK